MGNNYNIARVNNKDSKPAKVGEAWSSYKERRANALALGAEEGRDKLRKAAVRSTYPSTRRCPNGGTHIRQCVCILIPIHKIRKGTE